ncbi:NADP-dependent oxidoreductase [Streptomyces sp. LP05-1]|uniref:NADP-dependent oxidoreductase n=1 Tax=Streptomyces pyxinae TaxID=2970734 RepID=A0ABT2CNH6_9ACTN|nr:NADP-dependent oxidoreductase [Streptomyces sp. LP05-1]MCS0638995.1 NADP-dependent oxidoreductase [Streptomyces sp. LP05-1]
MRAITYTEFGGPEVLTLTETDRPEPGPGEIRARVVAAGVNPVDHKIRYGRLTELIPTTFPVVPGLEFAGVVDALGVGVTGVAVGDEVFGMATTGGYAEYTVAAAYAAKPAGLSFEQAAALPVAGETARRVLDQLGVTAGETLLLHGAAGAVGQLATQLAVARGATVIGTASPANHELLRELGAVPVAYGEGLADRVRKAAPQGVDAVFDAAGHDTLPVSVELRGGTIDRIITIAAVDAADHGVTFSGGGTPPETIRAWLAEQAGQLVSGELRLPVERAFPLAEAAEAQRASERGHRRGKLVILV